MSQKLKWAVDPAHTEIGFKVKHMMFTNVSGKFNDYEINVESDSDDFSGAVIHFSGESASISTGNADRDKHLFSADFFDIEKYPKIEFSATSFGKINDEEFELKGDLTMHGITKSITLAVEFAGLMKDPWGNVKAAFNISGKISRKDWGLTWNAALETGGVLVSEEVRIISEVQLIKQ